VTFNANGELEATAAPQVQSDWAEDDPVDVSFIRNKPGQTNLVAGTNITIVDDAQNNTVTISAASVSVPVRDVTIDNVSVVNAQGVAEIPRQVNADWNSSAGASEILNKPSIPVIGTITL
jgi:5-enolpyruvylshikimate-3-phosphate synthase